MSGPLLSVCIATFNRSRFLPATLDNICAQLTEETELVLVDGASTDDTAAIGAEYARRNPRVRFQRQEANGGVDRDFAAAVELAGGRYCWLFSDDDMLKPGAIARVLGHLHEGHGLIIANAEVRNADLSGVLEANRAGIHEDRVYAVGEDDRLYADTAKYLSFIGGVIIERALWMERPKERYFGSEFIHFGVIFQADLPASTLVLGDPLVEIRYGNAMWTARGFEIWMFRWPALVWSMPRSEGAKRTVVSRQRWRNPVLLLGHRAIGAYSMEEYKRLIAPLPAWMPLRLLAKAIAAIPGRALNAFARGVLRLMPARLLPLLRWDLRTSRFYGGGGAA